MDILTRADRRKRMQSVRQKGTKPELIVRSALHRIGFRFRVNVVNLPGRPDIVLPRHRAVIFVNGCFWHGHDCRAGRLPTSNGAFWSEKIAGNMERDARKARALRRLGWRVVSVWECKIRPPRLDQTIRRVARVLSKGTLHEHRDATTSRGR